MLNSLLFLYLQYFGFDFTNSIRLRFEDGLYLFQYLVGRQHKPDPSLLVVAIDEESVSKIGRWPWSRTIMAELVRRMSEAKLVAFDIVFSEPTEEDKVLADAIGEAGNVLLGFFLRKDSTKVRSQEDIDLLRNSELLRVKKLSDNLGLLEYPFAEVNLWEIAQNALMQAPFNAEPDPDGLHRRYPVAYLFHGSLYPSLALQAYRLYKNQDLELLVSSRGIEVAKLGDFQLPLFSRRYILLNPPSEVKVVSALDVLRGKVDLKDKVVFLGATEIGIYDIRPTPWDPTTPGVFLHYIALSNLLTRDLIKDLSHSTLLSILLLALIPLGFSKISRLRYRLVLYLGVFLFVLSLSLFSFSYLRLYIPFFYPLLSLTFSYVSVESYLYYISEKRVGELRKAFSSYVSPQLLEVILKNPERLKLGGEKREVTVLFSDIRGFTSLSEGLEPEVLVSLLNEYLEPMTLIVLREGGMLDKYIGDAIMAVFNAPVDLPDHTKRACMVALEMLRELRELNVGFRKKYGLELDIGIGINTGYAIVGNMGSDVRFDYTAIGDTVNLASRLEGLNKLYGTNIIVSEYTCRDLRDQFLFRPLDKVAVKGKKKPVMIFELMEDTPQNRERAMLYQEALELYFKGYFEEAALKFEKLVEAYRDNPSKTMLERCKHLEVEKPSFWEGVYAAKEK